jgi:AraC-like DNA-binding protein
MILSQSSKGAIDPLSDVLVAFDAKTVRRTRLEAAGDWALAFPALDRLKFAAVSKGSCWLALPGRVPRQIHAGDCFLIGRTSFVVASDPSLTPVDGSPFYAGEGSGALRLGGDDTVMLACGVAFRRGNPGFLLDLLPRFSLVPRVSAAALAVAATLSLIEREVEVSRIGGGIIATRLADVLIIEAMRACASDGEAKKIGWLGALADPRMGRALQLIHSEIAHPWTLERLARGAGMSRAAFAAEFARRMGQSPIAYVRAWRLAIARAALEDRCADIAAIATSVGYRSQSAFSHAFHSAFGVAPRAMAASR